MSVGEREWVVLSQCVWSLLIYEKNILQMLYELMKAFFIMSLTVNVKLEKLRLWMWLFYDWVYALFFQAALRVLTTVKVFSSSLKKKKKKNLPFFKPLPTCSPTKSMVWTGRVWSILESCCLCFYVDFVWMIPSEVLKLLWPNVVWWCVIMNQSITWKV